MDDKTPEPKGILQLATKISKPLPLAALSILAFVVIVLWLIAANSTNPLFKQVMNFLFVIVLVVVVLAFVAYLLTESWKRKPPAKPTTGAVALTGNVFYPGDRPAAGATVTVDGIMGSDTSDVNGWFALQALPRNAYTVRAVVQEWRGKTIVKHEDVEREALTIMLAQVAGSPVLPAPAPATTPTAPAAAKPAPAAAAAPVPMAVPYDAAAPSHQEFVQLFNALKDNFTLQDLHQLVQIDLEVNPQTIAGDTINEYTLELASFAKRHGRFNELRAAVKKARPSLPL